MHLRGWLTRLTPLFNKMERLKSKGSQSLHLLSILRADLGQEAWHPVGCSLFCSQTPPPTAQIFKATLSCEGGLLPSVVSLSLMILEGYSDLMLSQRDGAKAKRDFSGLPSPSVLVYFYSLSSLLDHLYHHDIETLPWYNFWGIRRQHLNLEIDLFLN